VQRFTPATVISPASTAHTYPSERVADPRANLTAQAHAGPAPSANGLRLSCQRSPSMSRQSGGQPKRALQEGDEKAKHRVGISNPFFQVCGRRTAIFELILMSNQR
jgi:hypothetical protein